MDGGIQGAEPHPLLAVAFHPLRHGLDRLGAAEQKAINLASNPHVILTTGCNDWDRGIDIVIEGDADQVTDDDRLKRLAGAWTTKWDGRWRYEARDGAFHQQP